MTWLETMSPLSLAARRLALALPLAFFMGCGDDDDAPASSDDGSTSSNTSPTSSSTNGTTTGSSDSQADADASGSTTSTEEETGTEESEYCGITNSGDAPWFTIRHRGAELDDGASLELECGAQGSFMFEFRVSMGGFAPPTDTVPFAVTMTVEGFDVGPGGAFYMTQNYPVYVGCDEFDGGLSAQNYIRIFPPDEIADLSEMDGAAVTISFVMKADGQELPFEVTGTMDAAEDESWGCCYDFELCF
jgi:hypothetical protein